MSGRTLEHTDYLDHLALRSPATHPKKRPPLPASERIPVRTLVWHLGVQSDSIFDPKDSVFDCTIETSPKHDASHPPPAEPRSPKVRLTRLLDRTDATYFAFSDELLYRSPHHLARQIASLEDDEGLAAVSSNMGMPGIRGNGHTDVSIAATHANIVLRIFAGDAYAWRWEPSVIRVSALRAAMKYVDDCDESVFFPFALPLALATVGRIRNQRRCDVWRVAPEVPWTRDALDPVLKRAARRLLSMRLDVGSPNVLSPPQSPDAAFLVHYLRSASTWSPLSALGHAGIAFVKAVGFRPGEIVDAVGGALESRKAEHQASEQLLDWLSYPEIVQIPKPFSPAVTEPRT